MPSLHKINSDTYVSVYKQLKSIVQSNILFFTMKKDNKFPDEVRNISVNLVIQILQNREVSLQKTEGNSLAQFQNLHV